MQPIADTIPDIMPVHSERRLAAILAADVVGYSRLMGADEEGTLARLMDLRREVLEPEVDRHRGRIVKTTGDGILAEFVSVVEAVRCGVAIQTLLRDRNGDKTAGSRLELRIGINLGDIIADEGDVFGDGVNIAARLEALALPGEILISRAVRDHIRDKLDLDLIDGGSVTTKNIARPIRVFRIALDGGNHIEPAIGMRGKVYRWFSALKSKTFLAVSAGFVVVVAAVSLLFLPLEKSPADAGARPTIVVIPLSNFGDVTQGDVFGDGLTDDLIIALSRFSEIQVIGRNASFHYKGKAVDLRQIGTELGAGFALGGSVRRVGERLRIILQLSDTKSGVSLWSESQDVELKDIFNIEDSVAARVATTATRKLLASRQQASRSRPPEEWSSYEMFLQARQLFLLGTQKGSVDARQLFERAIAGDPTLSGAWAWLSLSLTRVFLVPGSSDFSQQSTVERALEAASRAVALEPDQPLGYAARGYALVFLRRYGESEAAFERAVFINRNHPEVSRLYADALSFNGRHQESIEILQHAVRLDPYGVPVALGVIARGYYLTGNYERALSYSRDCVDRAQDLPLCLYTIATTLAQMGRAQEAGLAARQLLRAQPNFRWGALLVRLPFRRQEDKDRLSEGFRASGLPE